MITHMSTTVSDKIFLPGVVTFIHLKLKQQTNHCV